MAGKYKYTKIFRKKNPDYHKDYMLLRRRMYRKQYLAGKVQYEDIPKSYRYFTDSLAK